MESRLQLILIDAQRIRRIPVTSARFTIGSAPDNDLMIGMSGLARRHAVIECFDERVSVTDCGSGTGTFINGNQVYGDSILRDRDLLVLGEHCEIEIHISGPSASRAPGMRTAESVVRARNGPAETSLERRSGDSEPSVAARIAIPVMLSLAVVFISGMALYIGLSRSNGQTDPKGASSNATVTPEPPAGGIEGAEESSSGTSLTQINRLAVQVMSRISRDDKNYVFSETTLRELMEEIDRYRASPVLAQGLKEIDRDGGVFSIEVAREMQPSLVFYAALAETLNNQTGRGAMAAARDVLGTLREIRKDLGTDDADACLLVVAASKMKTRLLADALGRTSGVKDPYGDRDVWFLHNHGTIGDGPYRFVLKFLAVGVIAQAPGRFGIDAPALSF